MEVAHQLVRIFVEVDDFCKQLACYIHKGRLLVDENARSPRGPQSGLADSEIMTILLVAQYARFRDFKTFYGFLTKTYAEYFPGLPSYQRFIELMHRVTFPMILFVQAHAGKKTGLYYVDSSCLPVCHIKRSKRHKTFESIAKYGHTSVGCFFGLKLHIVTNHLGELMAFKITKGHNHDVTVAPSLLSSLTGLAFGDKGYLGKKLFDQLLQTGLKLVTKKRKNMKNHEPISSFEKQMLRKRGLIETVIGHLKHHFQIWHTRHRSMRNAITHLVTALAAYTIQPLSMSAMELIN